MKRLFQLLMLTAFLAACNEPQQEFTHSITATDSINEAELIYSPTGVDLKSDTVDGVYAMPLQKGEIVLQRVAEQLYTIAVLDKIGKTSFEEIPSKFINVDATVEVTRNIFQSYFPEEWEPMRGSKFTSLYIQNVKDPEDFFIKTVYTGTNKQIGMHSEDL